MCASVHLTGEMAAARFVTSYVRPVHDCPAIAIASAVGSALQALFLLSPPTLLSILNSVRNYLKFSNSLACLAHPIKSLQYYKHYKQRQENGNRDITVNK